jgi:hypothetical protein
MILNNIFKDPPDSFHLAKVNRPLGVGIYADDEKNNTIDLQFNKFLLMRQQGSMRFRWIPLSEILLLYLLALRQI